MQISLFGQFTPNPLFINESIYSKELEDRATHIADKYSIGTLIVKGETRYLSGDLIAFLRHLIKNNTDKNKRRENFSDAAERLGGADYDGDGITTHFTKLNAGLYVYL